MTLNVLNLLEMNWVENQYSCTFLHPQRTFDDKSLSSNQEPFWLSPSILLLSMLSPFLCPTTWAFLRIPEKSEGILPCTLQPMEVICHVQNRLRHDFYFSKISLLIFSKKFFWVFISTNRFHILSRNLEHKLKWNLHGKNRNTFLFIGYSLGLVRVYPR